MLYPVGFQVIERNKQASKLTADNLENKRRLERQMSPTAEFSGHLESIAESSLREDLSESEVASCLPSMPSQ